MKLQNALKSKRLKSLPPTNKIIIFSTIAVMAICGVYFLANSQAATSVLSTEPENGNLSGSVASRSDSAASNGKYIAFGASSTTPPSTPPTPPSPPPTGGSNGFYIVGSDVVAPDGKKFFPVGANVGIRNAFDWKGVATGRSAEAQQWGWNTIRLNFACTNRATYNTRYKDGYAALRKQVDAIINEYTAKKIVVIIECHDPYNQIWSTTEQQNTVKLKPGDPAINSGNQSDVGKTYRQQFEEFWIDSANNYKTNPYVWFNFWNEPFGTDNAAFISLNNHFYNMVRSRGAENIAIADAMNSGNDAGGNGALRLYHPDMAPKLAAGKCNMMFSLHAYGWGNSETSYKKLFDEMKRLKLSLIVGEYGYTIDGTSTAGGYEPNKMAADAMHKLAPQYGFGLQVWHGTHGDKYSLKKSGGSFYADGGAGANLSSLGQSLWNIGQNKPNLGTFTGNYADSRCASKQ